MVKKKQRQRIKKTNVVVGLREKDYADFTKACEISYREKVNFARMAILKQIKEVLKEERKNARNNK